MLDSSYKDLTGYVWANELMKKANKSPNTYKYWKWLDVLKCGSLSFLPKDRLIGTKYEPILDKCTNLDGLCPASHFLTLMNVSSSFLATLDKRPREGCRQLKSIWIGKIRFVKLPKWVEEKLKEGECVRILTSLDAGYYKEVHVANGIIYGVFA